MLFWRHETSTCVFVSVHFLREFFSRYQSHWLTCFTTSKARLCLLMFFIHPSILPSNFFCFDLDNFLVIITTFNSSSSELLARKEKRTTAFSNSSQETKVFTGVFFIRPTIDLRPRLEKSTQRKCLRGKWMTCWHVGVWDMMLGWRLDVMWSYTIDIGQLKRRRVNFKDSHMEPNAWWRFWLRFSFLSEWLRLCLCLCVYARKACAAFWYKFSWFHRSEKFTCRLLASIWIISEFTVEVLTSNCWSIKSALWSFQKLSSQVEHQCKPFTRK